MQIFILGSFHVLICNFMHQSVSVFVLNIELVKIIYQLEKNIFPQLKLLVFILKEWLSKPVSKCSSVFTPVFCLICGPVALHRQGAPTCLSCSPPGTDTTGYLFSAEVHFRTGYWRELPVREYGNTPFVFSLGHLWSLMKQNPFHVPSRSYGFFFWGMYPQHVQIS